MELNIFRTVDGQWATEWMQRTHLISLGTVEELTFVSMGFTNAPPLRFEINLLGHILSITDNRTGEPVSRVCIPQVHHMFNDVNIGKPI